MYGGEFARQVADEVAEMVDDKCLDPAVGAAILRVLRASNPEPGTAQGGDGMGGDGPVDSWGGAGKSRSGLTRNRR